MPKYKVPLTFYIEAGTPEEATHHASMIVRNVQGASFLNKWPTVDQGHPELVPEVMDPEQQDFRDGYADAITAMPASFQERVTFASHESVNIQPVTTNYQYGYLKALTDVLDEARRQASGSAGFGVDPEALQRRITEGGF
jgi:hypothetical protein